MKSKTFIFFLLFTILQIVPQKIQAQEYCENADFESGTFQNWIGSSGYCCPSTMQTPGITFDQHTIMSGLTSDPNTCDNVPVVAPGSTYSTRLGNSFSGSEAERLEYQFNISPENSMIIYKYAVVLEDPGHDQADQPRFEAQLLDQSGTVVPCTYYLVVADANLSGFASCGSVRYLNWTTVGVNVSAYIGQTLTLQFTTGDCGLGAHFGYAYVEASCAPFELDVRYCVDQGLNNLNISAPEGFENYTWETGGQIIGNGSVITIANPVEGQIINCTILSANGCIAELSATVAASDIKANFQPKSACPGDSLTLEAEANLLNASIASYAWHSSDGFISDSSTFIHPFTNSGNYTINLIITSDAGCVDSIQHSIEIHEIPETTIQFDSITCTEQLITFSPNTTLNNGNVSSYLWILNGTDSSYIQNFSHTFTDTGIYHIQLETTSDKGCRDTSIAEFRVRLSPNSPQLSTTVVYCPGDTVTISAETQAMTSIRWTGPDNFTSDQFTNTFPMYLEDIGNYIAIVTSDSNLCESPANIVYSDIVYKYNFDDFIFPNVITPNGDQVNDELELKEYFQTCESYHLIILNRWGNLVYEQTESNAPFKGIDISGERLNEGVYFYKLECQQGIKSGYLHVIND